MTEACQVGCARSASIEYEQKNSEDTCSWRAEVARGLEGHAVIGRQEVVIINCEWVQRTSRCIFPANWPTTRVAVEQHLARCKACAAELADQQEFQAQLNALPVEEPSAASWRRRACGCRSAGDGRAEARLVSPVCVGSDGMAAASAILAALAAVIFVVGFGGGIGAMYRAMSGKAPSPWSAAVLENLPSAVSLPLKKTPARTT